MFEIYTSSQPYPVEIDAVVRKNFQERVFPLTRVECPIIRNIIEKCWTDEYVQVSDVCVDLQAAQRTQHLSKQV